MLLGATVTSRLTPSLMIGVSVLLGAATTFQRPAQQSLIGAMVPGRLLSRAMAFSASVFQAAVIAGPAIAGLLFAFGGGAVYGVALASLVLSFGLVLRIGRMGASNRLQAFDADSLLAGVRFVRGNRELLGAISLDLHAVLLGGATALLPLYAKAILAVGATGLGILRSAPAVGA